MSSNHGQQLSSGLHLPSIHDGVMEHVFLGLKVWSIGDDHFSAGLLTQ
jgi:hypothetical protein